MLGRRIFVYYKGLVLDKHVNVRGRAKFYVRTKVQEGGGAKGEGRCKAQCAKHKGRRTEGGAQRAEQGKGGGKHEGRGGAFARSGARSGAYDPPGAGGWGLSTP